MIDWRTHPSFDGHEDVVAVGDEALGFAGIVAIHSTALGPAAGGCRIWDYDSADDALTDALRLSRGMTYKNAMADLPLGGGKAVHLPDERRPRRPLREVRRSSRERSAAATSPPKTSAPPSPTCAPSRGARPTSPALPKEARPSRRRSFADDGARRVRLDQGAAGRLGAGHAPSLCRASARSATISASSWRDEGAKLIVADVNQANLARAEALGAEIAPVDQIHAVAADLFSPCALGAGLNAQHHSRTRRADRLRRGQQPAGHRRGRRPPRRARHHLCARLRRQRRRHHQRVGRISGRSRPTWSKRRVRAIAPRLMRVLETAKSEGVPPHQAADAIVRERLAAARKG